MLIIVTDRRPTCWKSREIGHVSSSFPEKKASEVLAPADPNPPLAESVVSVSVSLVMGMPATGQSGLSSLAPSPSSKQHFMAPPSVLRSLSSTPFKITTLKKDPITKPSSKGYPTTSSIPNTPKSSPVQTPTGIPKMSKNAKRQRSPSPELTETTNKTKPKLIYYLTQGKTCAGFQNIMRRSH